MRNLHDDQHRCQLYRSFYDENQNPASQHMGRRENTFGSFISDNVENLVENSLVAASRVVISSRFQNQSKEILQQWRKDSDVSHRVLEFEFPSVVVTLHARFRDFGFAGGNEEAFDWLARGGLADDPRIPEVTGLRQLEGLAGERRQGEKVVLLERKYVSTRIYPDIGSEQGKGESVVFNWSVADDCKHQILPLGLPGLWVSDSLCPIPPVGDDGLHFGRWRGVV